MPVFTRNMSRRSFLAVPAFLPLAAFTSAFRSEEHLFQYESVIGTSLDLAIWTRRSSDAQHACQAVLGEIDRLASILDTRNPISEISRLADRTDRCSSELSDVLAAYEHWERMTGGVFSIRPGGTNTPRNVDALGKAYIIDRAANIARESSPTIDAVLLNIGGDISVWGRSFEIAVANPGAPSDNADPITRILLRDGAVATSGTYARGAHLSDGRTGQPLRTAPAATVVAANVVTANALATTVCLTEPHDGLRLVELTPGAEAMRMAPDGQVQRTSGFARLERPVSASTAQADWPPGYQLTVSLTLTGGRSSKRPYVAVWVEDAMGKLVRLLAVWGSKSKYFPHLFTLWDLVSRNQNLLRSVTRATRGPGRYELTWDGLDDRRQPAPLGTYRIVVETDQENGAYARKSGTIELGNTATSIALPASSNFEAVPVSFGPK